MSNQSKRTKITEAGKRKTKSPPPKVSPLDDIIADVPEEELTVSTSPKEIPLVINQQYHYPLSNFYPHIPGKKSLSLELVYKGKEYKTATALYYALIYHNKTEKEKAWRELIRLAPTPAIARRLGLQLEGGRYTWEKNATECVLEYKGKVRSYINAKNNYDADFSVRTKLMRRVLNIKFEQCESFREEVLEYGDKDLSVDESDEDHKDILLKVIRELHNTHSNKFLQHS